jgi:polysaccharide export outer membrane protein
MARRFKILIFFIFFIFSFMSFAYTQSQETQESEDLEDLDLDLEDLDIPDYPQEKKEPESQKNTVPQQVEPEEVEPEEVESEEPLVTEPRPQRPTSGKEYVFAPGDLIQVMVYGEPDLTTDTRVSQDGTIKLPLLGEIRTQGLTVRELESQVAELLAKDYLVNPQVTVSVKEYAKIFILGMVRSPGSYELKAPTTLSSAISMAGGLQAEANPSKVKLIRTIGQDKETKVINLAEISDNTLPDMVLKPNDTIVVEEYGRISIIGQVNNPGTYNLKKDLSLLEAIGLAGGFTRIADIDGTSVVRIEDGKKKIIRVRISDITKRGDKSKDIYLQPSDTVVVPESFF